MGDVVLALLAYASVNLPNEYQDFTSGLDAITVRMPFSSGSTLFVPLANVVALADKRIARNLIFADTSALHGPPP